VRRAEDDRKDVIVAILRNVTVDDPRLADYSDRQIMDLSTNPREELGHRERMVNPWSGPGGGAVFSHSQDP